jgi:hypothetical protein
MTERGRYFADFWHNNVFPYPITINPSLFDVRYTALYNKLIQNMKNDELIPEFSSGYIKEH